MDAPQPMHVVFFTLLFAPQLAHFLDSTRRLSIVKLPLL